MSNLRHKIEAIVERHQAEFTGDRGPIRRLATLSLVGLVLALAPSDAGLSFAPGSAQGPLSGEATGATRVDPTRSPAPERVPLAEKEEPSPRHGTPKDAGRSRGIPPPDREGETRVSTSGAPPGSLADRVAALPPAAQPHFVQEAVAKPVRKEYLGRRNVDPNATSGSAALTDFSGDHGPASASGGGRKDGGPGEVVARPTLAIAEGSSGSPARSAAASGRTFASADTARDEEQKEEGPTSDDCDIKEGVLAVGWRAKGGASGSSAFFQDLFLRELRRRLDGWQVVPVGSSPCSAALVEVDSSVDVQEVPRGFEGTALASAELRRARAGPGDLIEAAPLGAQARARNPQEAARLALAFAGIKLAEAVSSSVRAFGRRQP